MATIMQSARDWPRGTEGAHSGRGPAFRFRVIHVARCSRADDTLRGLRHDGLQLEVVKDLSGCGNFIELGDDATLATADLSDRDLGGEGPVAGSVPHPAPRRVCGPGRGVLSGRSAMHLP